MKATQWDEFDEHTITRKRVKGEPYIPICHVAPGMTATASLSGSRVDISITAVIDTCKYEGVVKRINSRAKSKINIKVGDTVVVFFKNIHALNQDIDVRL